MGRIVAAPTPRDDRLAGTARLSVVVAVSLASFVYSSILEYSLPLYFNAVGDFPKGMWSSLVVWQVAPWLLAPVLAGMLAKRHGECRVWAAALFGQAIVPTVLVAVPRSWIVAPIAVWLGITGAAAWVSGISLAQVVPPGRKGFANGLLMMSLGVGSVLGPLASRSILWSTQVAAMAGRREWKAIGAFLVNLTKPAADPPLGNFRIIFVGLSVFTLIIAVLVLKYGQRSGPLAGEAAQPGRGPTLDDFRRLLANPRFWGLSLGLCLFGGPVFEANNQYLLYRAEDLGLIAGPLDHGWILLQMLRPLMWIPGGLAVGLLAGRRAPGLVAVMILGGYAAASSAIGLAHTQVALFVAAAAFEFIRQCMRWLETGYLSEHMPADLRSTAIGCGVGFSSLGGGTFGFICNSLISPNAAGFESARPFWLAARIGLAGALGLLVFDRVWRIRQPPPGDHFSKSG